MSRSLSSRRQWLAVLLATGALASAGAAGAQQLPPLKPGLWVVEQQHSDADGSGRWFNETHQSCTAPTEDMQRVIASLTKQGCAVSGISRAANIYAYSIDCGSKPPGIQVRRTITVDGDIAYKLEASGPRGVMERTSARRIGDCGR